jgi:DNA-binding response OmpR family regulator
MTKSNCLIVDDDVLICFLLEKFMSEQKFSATKAYTGKKALELLHSVPYDLVFLDINLPDANGLDILKEIRKTDTAAYVVIMTASPSRENRQKSYEEQASYFLEKPFGVKELKTVVNGFLAREGAVLSGPASGIFSSLVSKEAYMISEYVRWKCRDEDLMDMTPSKARDLIIQCFFDAQKETFARAKRELGKEVSDPTIHNSVKSVVKLTFAEAGGNFENPSKEDLGRVVKTLALKASSWGTPADIIEYHKGEISKVLGSLG